MAAQGGPAGPDDVGGEDFVKGDFVICVARKTRFRRLHIVGGCPLVPGLDDRGFVVCGWELPARDTYAARCRNCWRGPEGLRRPPAKTRLARRTRRARWLMFNVEF